MLVYHFPDKFHPLQPLHIANKNVGHLGSSMMIQNISTGLLICLQEGPNPLIWGILRGFGATLLTWFWGFQSLPLFEGVNTSICLMDWIFEGPHYQPSDRKNAFQNDVDFGWSKVTKCLFTQMCLSEKPGWVMFIFCGDDILCSLWSRDFETASWIQWV